MERILFAITMVFFLLSIGSVLAYVCTVSCGEFWVNFETGGPYIKRQAFPTIFIVGNVNLANGTASYANVSIKIYEGSTLKASRNLIASSTGKFSETFRDIGIGSYDVEVSANYSLWTTYSNDSFKVIGMLAGCLEKNISLSGDALDYLTGSPISQGTVKIAIEENGDEYSTSFTNGKWAASFTSCFTPGQRNHAIVEITDSPTGRTSWGEIEFIAP